MKKQSIIFSAISTPSVIIDLNKLETNIREVSQLAAEAGVKLKPHTKIHGCVEIAKMQIEAGACGIEVGAIEQAEAMADGGISDIVVAHPFLDMHKLEILKKLLKKPKLTVTFVVDMIEQVENISKIGQSVGRKVPVLIKLDTGVDRFGVFPGEPTLNFARKIQTIPSVKLTGIYAHESGANVAKGIDKAAFEVATMVSETARMLRREGVTLETVSVGASPTFRSACRYLKEGRFPEITEIHPGSLVIGDIIHVMDGSIRRESCTLSVLTTIASTSHPNHVVVDAGFKTFGGDSMIAYRDTPGFFWDGKPSWGSVEGRQDLWFGRVSAEVGVVYYMERANKNLKQGERLRIVPNNATVVINTHDKIYGVRNGDMEKVLPVTGMGKGN